MSLRSQCDMHFSKVWFTTSMSFNVFRFSTSLTSFDVLWKQISYIPDVTYCIFLLLRKTCIILERKTEEFFLVIWVCIQRTPVTVRGVGNTEVSDLWKATGGTRWPYWMDFFSLLFLHLLSLGIDVTYRVRNEKRCSILHKCCQNEDSAMGHLLLTLEKWVLAFIQMLFFIVHWNILSLQ